MTTALDKPAPDERLKLTKGRRRGRTVPITVHSDAAQMRAATGTDEPDLAARLLTQAVRATPEATGSLAVMNAAVAAVAGIKPRDSLEGMLATQMVAVHNMAMEMASRALLPGQTTEGVDCNIGRVTRLMRTFAAQVEALQRYRSAGQQTVTVQHVHVADGGQAVIGSVSTGGGGGDG